MVRFDEINYKRIDYEKTKEKLVALEVRLRNSKNKDEFW